MDAVFQGGGIKGLAYIGALRYLEERGIRMKNCAGTSVGAIISSLIISGYTASELEAILNEIDVDLLWPKQNNVKKTYRTLTKGFLYSFDPLENYLQSLYRHKGISVFRDVKVGDDYRIKMITTLFNKRKLIVLPKDLKDYGINPDSFPIAKAACMSSALPLVYPPYKIGKLKFIDGGVIDNFPLWLFKNPLGFKLSKENNIISFAQNTLFKLPEKNDENIIFIDTSKYKAADFRKGYQERYYLYNLGYYYTKVFFDNYFRKRLELSKK